MSIKFSIDAKLYFCNAGIGGVPAFTLIPGVKNVTLDVKRGEADVTTRANGGWKAVAPILKEGSIETEMPWDPAAPGFADLQAAFLNGTPIGIACMDGPIGTAGSQGLWADCAVLDFTRDESLEDAMKAKISLKPTYSVNAPQWVTIGGGAVTSEFTLALVAGAGAIDLTNLAGDIDGTGKRATSLTVTNNGAHSLTISNAVADGYSLLAGGTAIIVDAGATVNMTLTESDTVGAGAKALTLAGTGTESATYSMTLAT